jgi:MFS family permease
MIRRPALILALLTALNLLNYLDRFVLAAVLPRVQTDLGLSNFQGGLLATAFLVGYFVTSPLFGWLANRYPRKALIAFGVFLWSLATAASGFASSAAMLLLARAFVGVGEASFSALAPTIIDDISPGERKNRSLAVFFSAMPIGSALGYVLGGALEAKFGWRSAFYAAAGPGLLLTLVLLFVADPERKQAVAKVPAFSVFGQLWARPLYRRAVMGYCMTTFTLPAIAYWAPKFLDDVHKMDLAKGNFVFGALTVVAGIVGTAIGGAWADREAKRMQARFGTNLADPAEVAAADAARAAGEPAPVGDRAIVHAALRVCFYGALVGTPFTALAFLAPSAPAFFALGFAAELFLLLAQSPINAALLRSVPEHLRASGMAMAIFLIHLFGDLWSNPLVGHIADVFGMRPALMILPLALGIAAAFWRVGDPPPGEPPLTPRPGSR